MSHRFDRASVGIEMLLDHARFLLNFALISTLCAATSCASHGELIDPAPDPAVDASAQDSSLGSWLPSPSELKLSNQIAPPPSPAYLWPDECRLAASWSSIYGPQRVDYATGGAGYSLAVFTPDWMPGSQDTAGLAYALYEFRLDTSEVAAQLELAWDTPPSQAASAWVGLANRQTDRWDWFPAPVEDTLQLPGWSQYDIWEGLASKAVIMLAVVVIGTQPVTLQWIRCGDNLPPFGFTAITPHVANLLPVEVTFDASRSFDADGQIVSFEWDLDGDGAYEAGTPTAQHRYATRGNYTAALRLTDDRGAASVTQYTITAGGWNIENLASERTLATDLVRDANGGLHLCLSDIKSGEQPLAHYFRSAGAWHNESVFPGLSPFAGTLVATPSGGLALVAMCDAGFCLASRDAQFWHVSVLDDVACNANLAMTADSVGRLHLAGTYQGELLYYRQEGAMWVGQPVGPSFTLRSGIAIDGTGTVHVVFNGPYADGTPLNHARLSGGSWHTEILPLPSNSTLSSKLVLTPDDQFGFLVSSPQGFYLVRSVTAGWNVKPIEEPMIQLIDSDLAFASSGKAHVCYIDEWLNGDALVCYAVEDGAGWLHETIDSLYRYGNCSIALDAGENPWVAYNSWTAQCFMAHRDP